MLCCVVVAGRVRWLMYILLQFQTSSSVPSIAIEKGREGIFFFATSQQNWNILPSLLRRPSVTNLSSSVCFSINSLVAVLIDDRTANGLLSLLVITVVHKNEGKIRKLRLSKLKPLSPAWRLKNSCSLFAPIISSNEGVLSLEIFEISLFLITTGSFC